MTLRAKIITYFVVLHVVMAAAAVFFLIDNSKLLFVVEGFFLLSIIVSFRLVRALFVPLDLITTGTELMNERDFGSRFVPVGQPELDRLIEIYNGMTDRLREERLSAEEQHQLLAKIVQASPSGIVICDFNGEVDLMNPAATRVVTPDLMTELRNVESGESRLVPYQGGRRLKIWSAEFRDRGFPKRFYLIEELTDELRLSEKAAYEKLIRMMSHEVNNSVGAVRSLLESLLRYAPDVREADRTDFTGAVTIASSRMDSLNRFMRDLADVVRIPPPHRTSTDLQSIVRDTAALLRPELDERRIDLNIRVDGTPAISVDRNQFEQVVLNILRNAIEAVGSKGAIDVALRERELTVADTGPGVAEEIRGELFSPFFSTKRDGRGLGLTVVQEILANHGFGYALENRAGGGAEFRITFR